MTSSEWRAVRWGSAVRVLAALLAMVPSGDDVEGRLSGFDADQGDKVPDHGVSPGSGAASDRIEALVTLAQAGDAEAFGLLYEEYVDSVYWFVVGRVGDRVLAEDLTSETFVRALRRLDSFSWQGRDIAAWFFTIARNLVTDHHRSSRYRLEVTTDDILGVERHGPAVGHDQRPPGPEDHALTAARDRQLVDAVRRLRGDQQECIVLRFFHDLSIAQTALALGRSEGAVKQLQLRAVHALTQIMRDPS